MSDATSIRRSRCSRSGSASSAGRVAREEPRISVEPFIVVDVQQPTDGPQDRSLLRACLRDRRPDLAAHLRPAVTARVNVLKFETAALEVLAEPNIAERAELSAALAPRAWNRLADAAKHDLLRHRVELQAAARRQERKVVLNLPLDVDARPTEKRPESPVEAELLAVRPDEVEHRAYRLARCPSQPSPELLQEERRTFGRAQQ